LFKLGRIFIVKVSLLRVTVCHFDYILHLAWGLLSSVGLSALWMLSVFALRLSACFISSQIYSEGRTNLRHIWRETRMCCARARPCQYCHCQSVPGFAVQAALDPRGTETAGRV